jgi:predicted ribosomally synthesized peptide with SipW-like signal peptide
MARSRKFFIVGAMGVGAMALIGAGASATFTASTDSNQTITAGTIRVVLSSPTSIGCHDATNGCTTLAFPTVAPVGSTFETATHRVTITNVGNIPVSERVMNLTDSNDSSSASLHLRAQMNVCVRSSDNTTNSRWVVANGPLIKGESLSPAVIMNQGPSLELAANGGTDFYEVSFYAGQDSACGRVTSAGSHTAEAWGVPHIDGDPAGGSTRFYTMPLSLTNEAMGGSVTPKISFNFEG